MKLYIAAMYQQLEMMKNWRTLLVEAGHEVTSQWLDGEAESVTRTDWALMDLDDVHRADALIFYSFERGTVGLNGGGRHVEFGYAIAHGKPIYVIGPSENIFHSLPNVSHYKWITDLITSLKEASQ